MKDIPPVSEYYDLYVLLLKTRHAVFRARVKELNEYGISPENALILTSITHFGDSATTKKISRDVFRKFNTVFTQLKNMEKEGLVERINDFPKKDRSRFVLTEKGLTAYANSARQESLGKIMSVLSEEERTQFENSLSKLLKAALKELNLPVFQHRS